MYWDNDKMAPILQTTFSNAFLWQKLLLFDSDFTEFVPNKFVNNIIFKPSFWLADSTAASQSEAMFENACCLIGIRHALFLII